MNKTMTISVDADQYEDADDCLAAAADDYVAAHPEAAGWDLSPRWANDQRDAILLDVLRTAEAWWRWHDAESRRWSGGENPDDATEEAERRADAWVAGESNDGPGA